MKNLSRLIPLVVLSVFVAACGPAPEKASAAKTPPAVDISALPEFLRYPGAVATEKLDVSTSDSRGTVWTLISGDTQEAISAWYVASVEKAGWVKSAAARGTMLEWDNKEKTETIKLLAYGKDGKTAISITHGLKPE